MSITAYPSNSYTPRRFWAEHREASLNWLALGILLAAWNVSNNDPAESSATSAADHAPKSTPEVSVRTRWTRESVPG